MSFRKFKYMQYIFFIFLYILSFNVKAQNIYSAIHYNDKFDVRSSKGIKKIEEITIFYNSNSSEKKRDIYHLNQYFYIIKQEGFDSENNLKYRSTIKYKNDSIKLSINSEKNIPIYGNERSLVLYEYDIKNYLVKITKKDNYNKIFEIITLENDSIGNPIMLVINNGEYGYEKAIYDYKSNTYSTAVFNTNNELIVSNKDIKLDFNIPNKRYTYNEQNDLVKDNKYIFEYKYDKYGNWTKKVRYKLLNDKKIRDAEFSRKITYL